MFYYIRVLTQQKTDSKCINMSKDFYELLHEKT